MKKKSRQQFTPRHTKNLRTELTALLERSNVYLLPERRVPLATALAVASRDLRKTRMSDPDARVFSAVRAVSGYIALAAHNKITTTSLQNADLLPIGHPMSTREHAMTASALRYAQAQWISADPMIDDSVRSLVASAHAAEPGSIERRHAFLRISALDPGLVPLTASIDMNTAVTPGSEFVFGFGLGGDSSAARSARAKMQRRDRYGKFAFMGGGFSFSLRGLDDMFTKVSGRIVGTPDSGDAIDIEVKGHDVLPDGIYTMPSSKGSAAKAILSEEAVKNLPNKGVGIGKDDVYVDVNDVMPTRAEAPSGWKKLDTAAGTPQLWGSPDGYFVKNDNGSYTLHRANLTDNSVGEEVARGKSWADMQKGALRDQDDYAKILEAADVAKPEGKPLQKNVKTLDPDSDVPLQKQIEDAIKSGDQISFKYSGKDRRVTPKSIYTNPNNGNVNLRAIDDTGVEKTFTLSKIEATKAAGAGVGKPPKPPTASVGELGPGEAPDGWKTSIASLRGNEATMWTHRLSGTSYSITEDRTGGLFGEKKPVSETQPRFSAWDGNNGIGYFKTWDDAVQAIEKHQSESPKRAEEARLAEEAKVKSAAEAKAKADAERAKKFEKPARILSHDDGISAKNVLDKVIKDKETGPVQFEYDGKTIVGLVNRPWLDESTSVYPVQLEDGTFIQVYPDKARMNPATPPTPLTPEQKRENEIKQLAYDWLYAYTPPSERSDGKLITFSGQRDRKSVFNDIVKENFTPEERQLFIDSYATMRGKYDEQSAEYIKETLARADEERAKPGATEAPTESASRAPEFTSPEIARDALDGGLSESQSILDEISNEVLDNLGDDDSNTLSKVADLFDSAQDSLDRIDPVGSDNNDLLFEQARADLGEAAQMLSEADNGDMQNAGLSLQEKLNDFLNLPQIDYGGSRAERAAKEIAPETSTIEDIGNGLEFYNVGNMTDVEYEGDLVKARLVRNFEKNGDLNFELIDDDGEVIDGMYYDPTDPDEGSKAEYAEAIKDAFGEEVYDTFVRNSTEGFGGPGEPPTGGPGEPAGGPGGERLSGDEDKAKDFIFSIYDLSDRITNEGADRTDSELGDLVDEDGNLLPGVKFELTDGRSMSVEEFEGSYHWTLRDKNGNVLNRVDVSEDGPENYLFREDLQRPPGGPGGPEAGVPAKPKTPPSAPPTAVSFSEDEFDSMFEAPDGAYKLDMYSIYAPKGRTNEDSTDYTDDPQVLSQKFSKEQLTLALANALVPFGGGDATGYGNLPFDGGDEAVKAEALFEALALRGDNDPNMIVATIYDSALDPDRAGVNMEMYKQRLADDEMLSGDQPGLSPIPTVESSFIDSIKKNEALGVPSRTQLTIDLLKDYNETNPHIISLAENLKEIQDELEDLEDTADFESGDSFMPLLAKYLPWSESDNPEEKAAFRGYWGLLMSLDGGSSEENETTRSGFRKNLFDAIAKHHDAQSETEAQDLYDEFVKEFGNFRDFANGKESIADGLTSLDDDTVAGNFFRLIKASARPNEQRLFRVSSFSPSNTRLQNQYTTVGNILGLDPRPFSTVDSTGGTLLDSLVWQPNDKNAHRVVFVAAPGEVDSIDVTSISWFPEEQEHISYGQLEIVSVRRQPSGNPERPDEFIVQVRRTDKTPADLVGEQSAAAEQATGAVDLQTYDVSGWKQTGEKAGSNEGGFYEDADGVGYYVKIPKSTSHAENEVLASVFYQELGVPAAEVRLGDDDGEQRIVSRLIPGVVRRGEYEPTDLEREVRADNQDYLAKIRADFAIDAWLSNYDVTGTGWDNIVTDGNGDPVRVDPGGALMWRARGAAKEGMFGDTVNEIDGLRDADLNYFASAVFGDMTDEDVRESAKKLLDISPSRIDEIIDTVISSPSDRALLKERLKNRRQYILDRFGLSENDDDVLGTPVPLTNSIGFAAQDLAPGDITADDSFVIEGVFRDKDTPKGKVSVQGYYPGHESQRKEWNENTVINAARGSTVPPKGDAPAIHRPAKPYEPTPPAFTGDIADEIAAAESWDDVRRILNGRDLVFFDYETTGFDAGHNNMPVQLGAVKIRDGQVVDRFNLFMDPREELSQWSLDNLKDGDGNPLTDEFLAQQAGMGEAHALFAEWAGNGSVLVAHNTPFDREILERVNRQENVDFTPGGYVDTLALSRALLKKKSSNNPDGPTSHRLPSLLEHYGQELDGWHTADADAEAVSGLLGSLLDDATGKPDGPELLGIVKDQPEAYTEAMDRHLIALEKYKDELAKYNMDKAIAAAWNCGGSGITAAVGEGNGPCSVPSVDELVETSSVKPGSLLDPEAVTSGDPDVEGDLTSDPVEVPSADGKDSVVEMPVGIDSLPTEEERQKNIEESFNSVDEQMNLILDPEMFKLKNVLRKEIDAARADIADVRDKLKNGEITEKQAIAMLNEIIDSLPTSKNADDLDIEIGVLRDTVIDLRSSIDNTLYQRPQGPGLPPLATHASRGYSKDGVFLLPGAKVRDKWGYSGTVLRYNEAGWLNVYFVRDIDGKAFSRNTQTLTTIADGEDNGWSYIPGMNIGKLPDDWESRVTPDEKAMIQAELDKMAKKASKKSGAAEEANPPKAEAPKGAPEAPVEKENVEIIESIEVVTPVDEADVDADEIDPDWQTDPPKTPTELAKVFKKTYKDAKFGADREDSTDEDYLESVPFADYTADGYFNINNFLRGKVKKFTFKKDEDDAKSSIEGIDRLFDKAPTIPEDMVLHRGIHSDYANDVIAKYQVGDLFTDQAYVSTSTDKQQAEEFATYSDEVDNEGFTLEILVPAGTRGIYVPEYLGSYQENAENEIVLDRGTTFRVIARTEDASGKLVSMRIAVVDQVNKPKQPKTETPEPEVIESDVIGPSGRPLIEIKNPRPISASAFEGVDSLMDAVGKVTNKGDSKLIFRSAAVDSSDIEDLEVRAMVVVDMVTGERKLRLKYKLTAWAGYDKAEYLRDPKNEGDGTGNTWAFTKDWRVPISRLLENGDITIARGTGVPLPMEINSYSHELDVSTGKAEIRILRDRLAGLTPAYAKSFHNLVTVDLPIDATEDDIKKALEESGVRDVRAAERIDLKTLSENRLLSVFRREVDASTNVTEQQVRQSMLDEIKNEWGVGPEDIEVSTDPAGFISFNLPQDVAEKIVTRTNTKAFRHSLSITGIRDSLQSAMKDWLYLSEKEQRNLVAGVVADIIQGGLKSTLHRFTEGSVVGGMSSETDLGTGGADYVFLSPKEEWYANNVFGDDLAATLVFDPLDVYRRLDFYANYNDKFGERRDGTDVIEEARAGAYEVMFKRGLSLDSGLGLIVSRRMREAIIEELKNRGVETVAGMAVEDFVTDNFNIEYATKLKRGDVQAATKQAQEFINWMNSDTDYAQVTADMVSYNLTALAQTARKYTTIDQSQRDTPFDYDTSLLTDNEILIGYNYKNRIIVRDKSDGRFYYVGIVSGDKQKKQIENDELAVILSQLKDSENFLYDANTSDRSIFDYPKPFTDTGAELASNVPAGKDTVSDTDKIVKIIGELAQLLREGKITDKAAAAYLFRISLDSYGYKNSLIRAAIDSIISYRPQIADALIEDSDGWKEEIY